MPGRLDIPYVGYNDPHEIRQHPSTPGAPSVSPEMFGAQIARAGAGLGESLEGIAHRYAELNNEMGATERFTNAMTAMDNVWTEFAQLHGNDATSRLPEFKQKLNEAHESGLEGIPNIVQKNAYLRQSRMYLARQTHALDAHSVQQNAAAIVKTTADAEQAFSDRAIVNSDPGHEADFDLFVNSVAGERQKQARYLGLNQASDDPNAPAPWEGHISGGVGKTVHEAVAFQLQNGHLDQANKIFEKYRGRMDGLSTVATMKLLHPANLNEQTGGWADHYMPWTAEGYTPPAKVQGGAAVLSEPRKSVAGKIVKELRSAGLSDHGIRGILANVKDESDFNSGLRHPDQPNWDGEAHYAHGLYQEGGQGWNDYSSWLKKNYPDAQWQDPVLQTRFLAYNLKTNYPSVWKSLHEGTPEIAAQAFVSGYLKPAKQYEIGRNQKYAQGVPDLDHFFSGSKEGTEQNGGAQQPLGHPSIQQTLQQVYNNPEIRKNPELLRKVQTEIHQRYQAFDVTSAAQRNAVDAGLTKLSQRVADGETDLTLESEGLSEELVRSTLHPAAADMALEKIYTGMQLTHDFNAMRFAPPEQVNQFLDGLGGEGEGLKFPHKKSAQNIAITMAQDWLKKRQQDLADPATYVSRNPQVVEKAEALNRIRATAQEVLNHNPPQQIKDKTAADINDAWGRYVTTSLATQAYLGLPEEDRHVFTVSFAKEMVKKMQSGETDIKTELDSLQKSSGAHWPRALRDLVNLGGLSADAQALQMIPDTDAADLSWFMKQYSGKTTDANGEKETVEVQLKRALSPTSSVKNPEAEVKNLILKDQTVINMRQAWRTTAAFGSATDTEKQIAALTGAIDKLAYARMLIHGEVAAVAVDHAIHAFTDPWEFSRDGALIPRGKSHILDNANGFLQTLPFDQVRTLPPIGINTPFGTVAGLTPEQYWEAVKASPAWVTNASHDGLWLTDANVKGGANGVLVRKKDGSPVEWKFNQQPSDTALVPRTMGEFHGVPVQGFSAGVSD